MVRPAHWPDGPAKAESNLETHLSSIGLGELNPHITPEMASTAQEKLKQILRSNGSASSSSGGAAMAIRDDRWGLARLQSQLGMPALVAEMEALRSETEAIRSDYEEEKRRVDELRGEAESLMAQNAALILESTARRGDELIMADLRRFVIRSGPTVLSMFEELAQLRRNAIQSATDVEQLGYELGYLRNRLVIRREAMKDRQVKGLAAGYSAKQAPTGGAISSLVAGVYSPDAVHRLAAGWPTSTALMRAARAPPYRAPTRLVRPQSASAKSVGMMREVAMVSW